jgi:hypothetical protein
MAVNALQHVAAPFLPVPELKKVSIVNMPVGAYFLPGMFALKGKLGNDLS